MQNLSEKQAEMKVAEIRENQAHAEFIGTAKTQERKGKSRKVEIDSCYVQDNPREDHDVAPIVGSYRRHGFLLNEPLVVAETDKGFLVVRGNRRYLAIKELRENYPEDFKNIFPDGKVPAIVHKTKSEQEIALLRIDFDNSANRKPLSKYEEFLAVRLLVRSGYMTESGIAEKMGKVDREGNPQRSWAQNRVRLAKMPRDVQEMFKPVFADGKNESNTLKVSDIPALAKQFRETGDSDEFRKVLTERANREKKTGKTNKPKYAVPAQELKDRLNSFESDALKRIFNILLSDGEGIADLDDSLTELESDSKLLKALDERFGDQLTSMIDSLD